MKLKNLKSNSWIKFSLFNQNQVLQDSFTYMHKHYYNDNNDINKYFEMAHEASAHFRKTKQFHIINNYLKKGYTICELGCGEGSKIASFDNKKFSLYGIDISETAIIRAKQQYPQIQFTLQDIESKATKNSQYDCTMSYFVLEHIENPEIYIDQMISITKNGGTIVLWFPNYGSPLFPSPPTLYKKTTFQKIFIIIKRIIRFIKISTYYTAVKPITEEYACDYDVVSEIYMGKFRELLLSKGLEIKYESSCWFDTPKGLLFKLYFPFKLLGIFSPFKYRGVGCFMVLQKK